MSTNNVREVHAVKKTAKWGWVWGWCSMSCPRLVWLLLELMCTHCLQCVQCRLAEGNVLGWQKHLAFHYTTLILTLHTVCCGHGYISHNVLVLVLSLDHKPHCKPDIVVIFSPETDLFYRHSSCSSCCYTSIDGVGFLIWHHNFKMAATTSFMQKSASAWCVFTHGICPVPMQQCPPGSDP